MAVINLNLKRIFIRLVGNTRTLFTSRRTRNEWFGGLISIAVVCLLMYLIFSDGYLLQESQNKKLPPEPPYRKLTGSSSWKRGREIKLVKMQLKRNLIANLTVNLSKESSIPDYESSQLVSSKSNHPPGSREDEGYPDGHSHVSSKYYHVHEKKALDASDESSGRTSEYGTSRSDGESDDSNKSVPESRSGDGVGKAGVVRSSQQNSGHVHGGKARVGSSEENNSGKVHHSSDESHIAEQYLVKAQRSKLHETSDNVIGSVQDAKEDSEEKNVQSGPDKQYLVKEQILQSQIAPKDLLEEAEEVRHVREASDEHIAEYAPDEVQSVSSADAQSVSSELEPEEFNAYYKMAEDTKHEVVHDNCDAKSWIFQNLKQIMSNISHRLPECNNQQLYSNTTHKFLLPWRLECDTDLKEIYRRTLLTAKTLRPEANVDMLQMFFNESNVFVPLHVRITILNRFLETCGFEQRLPDVVNIGVTRSGTSVLQSFLGEHPQISQPLVSQNPREMHLFAQKNDDLDLEMYKSRMGYVTSNMISFEINPWYFTTANAPENIMKELPPHVKFILCVRDPIDRIVSEFRQVINGSAFVNRTSQNESLMFENEVLNRNGEIDTSNAIIDTSLYSKHFINWLKYFSRERFLIISYENFVNNPVWELQRIETFLGINKFFSKDKFKTTVNMSNLCYEKVKINKEDVNVEMCLGLKKATAEFLKEQVSERTLEKLCNFFKPHNQDFVRMANMTFDWYCV